ncbi:hypothetical protein PENTCL1PPCAC_10949, partial [Pristionchus entomophagus]
YQSSTLILLNGFFHIILILKFCLFCLCFHCDFYHILSDEIRIGVFVAGGVHPPFRDIVDVMDLIDIIEDSNLPINDPLRLILHMVIFIGELKHLQE